MIQEITTTRANPLVDPSLSTWHGEVAAYLFLGGIVAGLMVLTGARLLRPADTPRSRDWSLLPWAAPVLLSIGMLFLFLDLAHKAHVYRFYLAFRPTSPMSWGAWILVAIYPVTLLLGWFTAPTDVRDAVAKWLPARMATRLANCPPRAPRVAAMLNVILGIALGIYTGVLLGALAARPLWNSALLGPLFLTSGLSTGAALMLLFRLSDAERAALARTDLWLIVAELALIVLWLVGLAAGGGATSSAAGLLLGGPFTAAFWTIVVVAGLLTPLFGEWFELRHGQIPGRFTALLVLGGGLALRWIVLAAGQYSGWAAGVASR